MQIFFCIYKDNISYHIMRARSPNKFWTGLNILNSIQISGMFSFFKRKKLCRNSYFTCFQMFQHHEKILMLLTEWNHLDRFSVAQTNARYNCFLPITYMLSSDAWDRFESLEKESTEKPKLNVKYLPLFAKQEDFVSAMSSLIFVTSWRVFFAIFRTCERFWSILFIKPKIRKLVSRD